MKPVAILAALALIALAVAVPAPALLPVKDGKATEFWAIASTGGGDAAAAPVDGWFLYAKSGLHGSDFYLVAEADILASFVPGEWLTHAGPEADLLRHALTRIDQEAERFHDACGHLGIVPHSRSQATGICPCRIAFTISPRGSVTAWAVNELKKP